MTHQVLRLLVVSAPSSFSDLLFFSFFLGLAPTHSSQKVFTLAQVACAACLIGNLPLSERDTLALSLYTIPADSEVCPQLLFVCEQVASDGNQCHVTSFIDELRFSTGSGCNVPSFTTLQFSYALSFQDGLDVANCDFLETILFERVTTFSNALTSGPGSGGIIISNNELLQSVSFPELVTISTNTQKAIDIKNNNGAIGILFPKLESVLTTSDIGVNVVETEVMACANFVSLVSVNRVKGNGDEVPAVIRITSTDDVAICPQSAGSENLNVSGVIDLNGILDAGCDVCCPTCGSGMFCESGQCIPGSETFE